MPQAGQKIRATDLTDLIQAGTELITFTDQSSWTQTIMFPRPFAGAPVVHPQIASGSGVTARWGARSIGPTTETSFRLFLFSGDSPATIRSWPDIPVTWIAIYNP